MRVFGRCPATTEFMCHWSRDSMKEAPSSPNGLFLFGRGCRLPNDRNFITVSVDAGAVYKGIFRRQKESQDSLGIGFVYNSVSDRVRHAVAVARNEGVQGV